MAEKLLATKTLGYSRGTVSLRKKKANASFRNCYVNVNSWLRLESHMKPHAVTPPTSTQLFSVSLHKRAHYLGVVEIVR